MTASFAWRLAIALAAIGISVAAVWALPLDGVARGGPLRLVGRLHPLLVHFPLSLLLLVPVLEIAGRHRPGLREAAGFVLGLAFAGAMLSVLAGIALARADGHEGSLVSNHLWGGLAVAIGTALAWAVRGRVKFVYFAMLFATVGTLGWAAHQGGSLTHGAEYLTESLPSRIKTILRIREAPPPETYDPGTVFATAVHPIFEKHCLACHGAEKQRGEYRMDSFAAMLGGGKSGKPAIVAGQVAQSELVRRMLLGPTDDKAMPPPKRPRPTAGEIALIRWWIKQGAERNRSLAEVKDAPRDVAALLAASSVDASGAPIYVARVGDFAVLQPRINALETELGIKLVRVSKQAGDGLILRTRGAESRFGDAELARLADVAPYIVEAELTGTKLTDAGLAALQPFSQLARLHLDRTRITGETLGELRQLEKLTYLNLCSTLVSDEALAFLGSMPALQQLYLFGSRVTPAGVQQLHRQLPECQIGPVEFPKKAAVPLD